MTETVCVGSETFSTFSLTGIWSNSCIRLSSNSEPSAGLLPACSHALAKMSLLLPELISVTVAAAFWGVTGLLEVIGFNMLMPESLCQNFTALTDWEESEEEAKNSLIGMKDCWSSGLLICKQLKKTLINLISDVSKSILLFLRNKYECKQ